MTQNNYFKFLAKLHVCWVLDFCPKHYDISKLVEDPKIRLRVLSGNQKFCLQRNWSNPTTQIELQLESDTYNLSCFHEGIS